MSTHDSAKGFQGCKINGECNMLECPRDEWPFIKSYSSFLRAAQRCEHREKNRHG